MSPSMHSAVYNYRLIIATGGVIASFPI